MTRIIRIAVSAVAVVALCLSAVPAFAEGGSGGTSGTSGHDTTRIKTEAENEVEVHNAAEQTSTAQRLEDKQKAETEHQEKVCTNKRRVVGNILNRIADRGQKQIAVFTKIADRTEQFKDDKNLTVTNYDSLVATVDAKKTAAQDTINKIKADAVAASNLSCDSGQPKAVVGGFRDDLKAENSVLKAYKTAIKNLIVAVKSSQSSTEGDQ
jgi:hypothetical protein